MEFGTVLLPNANTVREEARVVEEIGFTHLWFGEVPHAGSGDPYIAMALAAVATRRLMLGAYVASAPLRDPVSVVNSAATINALAPGRLILGVGSGSFSRLPLGRPPWTMKQFREHVRMIRELLDSGEAQPSSENAAKVRFYNRHDPMETIRLEPKIPLYVAAGGQKTAEIAGEFADGLITATAPEAGAIAPTLARVEAAALAAGRRMGAWPYIMESPLCVLRRGETLASPRIIEIAQPWIMTIFRWKAALQVDAPSEPEAFREPYRDYVASLGLENIPPSERHLAIWEGVFMPRAGERRFITPEAVRATMLAGELDEVIDRVNKLCRAGLTQLSVWPDPTTGRWEPGAYLDGVREVMMRMAGDSSGRAIPAQR